MEKRLKILGKRVKNFGKKIKNFWEKIKNFGKKSKILGKKVKNFEQQKFKMFLEKQWYLFSIVSQSLDIIYNSFYG